MIVDLNLRGKLVIVVGAGSEALKKINSLLTQDCKIMVFSDKANRQIESYAKQKKIEFNKVRLNDAKFILKHKPFLVMAATDDRELNRKIVKKAKTTKCYVYAADDPQVSDFAHPSVINIEDTVQVAISTGGRSPAMARKLKLEAEKIFKKIVKIEDIYQIKLQQIAREKAKEKLDTQIERKKFLYKILNDQTIKQLLKDRKFENAQKRAMLILKEWK